METIDPFSQRKHKAMASPHTWGSMLKTHCVSHLAAGLEKYGDH